MKFIITLLVLFPLACSNGTKYNDTSTYGPSTKDVIAVSKIAMEDSPSATKVNAQKLIKTARLSYETQDMSKAFERITKIVSTYNGYVQNDSETKGYRQLSRNVVVRFPSKHFEHALNDISKTVDYFDSKETNSKDVTEEFIDIEARLKAKLALEKRYTELLSKAKNVKEILDIERELSVIREEIEAKQGRLNYLQDKVALSTITIHFYKKTSEIVATQSYGSKMWNAITSGFNGLSFFFLGVLHIWPFIIILAVVVVVIRRRFFKKKTK